MLRLHIAAVVQLVEHPDMDREVAGSSPAIRSDESLKAFAFETFLYSYSKTYVDISVAVAAENKK